MLITVSVKPDNLVEAVHFMSYHGIYSILCLHWEKGDDKYHYVLHLLNQYQSDAFLSI